MKRSLILVIMLLVFSAMLVGCTNNKEEKTIVVGMECDYAPFNWTETTKTDSNVAIDNVPGAYAEGYDVQIAKKIANKLGYTLKIQALDWDALIPALKNGTIDLIIAGMSPTEERKESIDFTDGYYRSTHVILTKKTSAYASVTKLEELAGAKIAGQLGTIYADLVPQAVEKGAIAGTDLSTVGALVNQIKNDVIDGTIVEEPVAIGLTAADDTLSYIKFDEGYGFTVNEEDVLVSIGIRKEYELKDAINQALSEITDEQRKEIMTTAVNNNSK